MAAIIWQVLDKDTHAPVQGAELHGHRVTLFQGADLVLTDTSSDHIGTGLIPWDINSDPMIEELYPIASDATGLITVDLRDNRGSFETYLEWSIVLNSTTRATGITRNKPSDNDQGQYITVYVDTSTMAPDTSNRPGPIYHIQFIDRDTNNPIQISDLSDIAGYPTMSTPDNGYTYIMNAKLSGSSIGEISTLNVAGKYIPNLSLRIYDMDPYDVDPSVDGIVRKMFILLYDAPSTIWEIKLPGPKIHFIDADTNNPIPDVQVYPTLYRGFFNGVNGSPISIADTDTTNSVYTFDDIVYTNDDSGSDPEDLPWINNRDIIICANVVHDDYETSNFMIYTNAAFLEENYYVKMTKKQSGGVNTMSGEIYYSQIDMRVTPTEPNHVVRLTDVLDLVDGKTKAPVRVISTTNLVGVYSSSAKTFTASSNGVLVVDSITVALNDRILLNGQNDKTQNGIYVVTTLGTGSAPFVLTRDADMDTSVEIYVGMRVLITEGTLYAGTVWKLQGTGPFTLDSSNIEFAQDIVKYTEILEQAYDITGDGTTLEHVLTHNFGTKDVTIEFYNKTTGETVHVLAQRTSVNDVKVITGVALISSETIRVIIRAVVNPV